MAEAHNLLTAEMDSALQLLGITSPQMGLLLAIQRSLATTPFELSKILSVDSGLMMRILDKLDVNGLLERSRRVDDRRVGQPDVD